MTTILECARISSVLVSCALLFACSSDAPPPARTATTSDSAGIRIVEYDSELPATEIPVELVWRDADGSVVQILRWDPTPRYPDEALWTEFAAALRGELERLNPDMDEARLRPFLDRQTDRYEPDPSVPLPLFSYLQGGHGGEVWLSEYTPANTRASTYTVVASDGEVIGRVEFPTPFHVLDVDGGYVLGVFTDELDVQAVAVYRHRAGR